MPFLFTALLALALLAPAVYAQEGGGEAPPPTGQQPPPPPPPPPPTPKLVVQPPSKAGVAIREGQGGRLLLGGVWYFRQDDSFVGEQEGWFTQRSLAGWTQVSVPHNWNASDTQLNRSSVGWYRREFRLPRTAKGVRWRLRLEGANHRSVVWLNGRELVRHVGGYFPFEVDLEGLRKGRNRLVVKVSTLRSATDLTHWRPASFNGYGSGGWWNFGGLTREVYVRPVDTVDIEQVHVLPRLRCVRCDAVVEVRMRVRNLSRRKQKVALALALGGGNGVPARRVELRPRRIDGRAWRDIGTRFEIERPRLWQPGRPSLYDLTVSAATKAERRSSYRLAFGVRRIERRRDGAVLLNGRKLQLRGASVHEDDPRAGHVSTVGQRRTFLRRLRQLGASVTRAHYPVHPALLEALDRAGILFWAQAPVYQLPNSFLDRRNVRGAAVRAVRETVRHNLNHPSILAWSIGNELGSSPSERGAISPGHAAFIKESAAGVRELDDTRLVAIDRASRIGEPLDNRALGPLDAIGVNEYFGWYNSSAPGLPASRTEDLGPFLDALHAAQPRKALFVTEFGAEATRYGAEEQKGTFEFQRRWMRDHVGVHASKPYVSASIAWILKDFRVHPDWLGGAPAEYGTPPWNNKGLVEEGGGLKPAFFEMRRLWRSTRPLR
jgi:beta-glucuronidase